MHLVFIILTLTFIQGHTDRNRDNNKCFDYFRNYVAVKIVRLKVCMTIASPMTWTFIQGHKYASNLTTF